MKLADLRLIDWQNSREPWFFPRLGRAVAEPN